MGPLKWLVAFRGPRLAGPHGAGVAHDANHGGTVYFWPRGSTPSPVLPGQGFTDERHVLFAVAELAFARAAESAAVRVVGVTS